MGYEATHCANDKITTRDNDMLALHFLDLLVEANFRLVSRDGLRRSSY